MKFNLAKAGTYTGTIIDDVNYRYGWYESGRAFIAKEDELMTYKVPPNGMRKERNQRQQAHTLYPL